MHITIVDALHQVPQVFRKESGFGSNPIHNAPPTASSVLTNRLTHDKLIKNSGTWFRYSEQIFKSTTIRPDQVIHLMIGKREGDTS